MDAQVHHAIARLKDALTPFDFVLCIQDDSRQRYWSCSDRSVQEELEHKGGIILSDVDIILEDEKEIKSSRSEGRRPPLLQAPSGVRPSSSAESFSSPSQGASSRARPPLLPRPAMNANVGSSTSLSSSSAPANEPQLSWSFTSSTVSFRESLDENVSKEMMRNQISRSISGNRGGADPDDNGNYIEEYDRQAAWHKSSSSSRNDHLARERAVVSSRDDDDHRQHQDQYHKPHHI